MVTQPKEVFAELAAQGIIMICGEVTGNMVKEVGEALVIARANRAKELEINIRSNGGSVRAGLDIYDMIRAAPVEKRRGLVLGFARSMGAIILQACEERVAMRHARILVHFVSKDEVSLATLRDTDKLNKLVADAESDQRYIDTILTRCTKRSLDEIQAASTKDMDMTTDEAKEFGLIDNIRD